MPTSSDGGRRGRSAGPPSDPRMPALALAAGVIGIVGLLPTGLLALTAVALGGLTADDGRSPWTYLVLAAPVVQLWGAVWLLARRGWLPLMFACLPVALLTGGVVWAAARAGEGGLGWPLLLLVAPVLAAGLAATPRVRRWVANRPPPH